MLLEWHRISLPRDDCRSRAAASFGVQAFGTISCRLPQARCTARFHGWSVDLVSHEVTAPQGMSVPVTGNEFQLLSSMLARLQHLLTREEILGLAFGGDWSPASTCWWPSCGASRGLRELGTAPPLLIAVAILIVGPGEDIMQRWARRTGATPADGELRATIVDRATSLAFLVLLGVTIWLV